MLSELLMDMQRGRATSVDASLSDVQWDADDLASRSKAACLSPGRAISSLASARILPGDSSLRVRVFMNNIRAADSSGVHRIYARITILSALARVDTGVVFEYDPTRVRLQRARGLLSALCAAAQ
jgi:hypothetical protein